MKNYSSGFAFVITFPLLKLKKLRVYNNNLKIPTSQFLSSLTSILPDRSFGRNNTRYVFWTPHFPKKPRRLSPISNKFYSRVAYTGQVKQYSGSLASSYAIQTFGSFGLISNPYNQKFRACLRV